jgi:hypothetical protein
MATFDIVPGFPHFKPREDSARLIYQLSLNLPAVLFKISHNILSTLFSSMSLKWLDVRREKSFISSSSYYFPSKLIVLLHIALPGRKLFRRSFRVSVFEFSFPISPFRFLKPLPRDLAKIDKCFAVFPPPTPFFFVARRTSMEFPFSDSRFRAPRLSSRRSLHSRSLPAPFKFSSSFVRVHKADSKRLREKRPLFRVSSL